MNCTTGEISSELDKIMQWREQGDRVLMLPGDADYAEMKAAVEPEPAPSVLSELGFQVAEIEAQVRGSAERRSLDFVRRVQARC